MVDKAHTLSNLEQLDEIVELSKTANCGVAIYKHSTHCGVSMMVSRAVRSAWDIDSLELPFYYLDLIRYRTVSNEVANKFNVRHESPQILIIKDGKCVYHASHSAISVDSVKEAVQCYA